MDWKWLNDKKDATRWKRRYAYPFQVVIVAPFYWALFTAHYWYAAAYLGGVLVVGLVIAILSDKS